MRSSNNNFPLIVQNSRSNDKMRTYKSPNSLSNMHLLQMYIKYKVNDYKRSPETKIAD